MHAARDQAGNVRHVEDINRAHLVGNQPHAGKVPQPRVGAAAANDGLGPLAFGAWRLAIVMGAIQIVVIGYKRRLEDRAIAARRALPPQ